MAHLTRRSVVTTALATTAAGVFIPAQTAAAAPAAQARPRGPRPLARAHAHNDYLHPRPLHDALAHGFTSVEADIFLVDGELLVAHEAGSLDPARTLTGLYLDPLAARVRANHGSVHAGHRDPLQLLIDIKTDGAATYLALDRVLRRYRHILSHSVHGQVRTGAVTPVISGDRAARVPMEAQTTRYAFYDGRPEDLGGPAPASFVPLISGNWTQSFTWLGTGPFPAAERDRLRTFVTTAHAAGQRVRFWGTPDVRGPERDAVWTELVAADVDHLNSDDLDGLESFLRRRGDTGRRSG
ncbi:phosphatidylinositol-specific phospholipase C/glycerophosphodiester phosphodiesterase family protein [Streptomyces sp. NBC_01341]|uniref:phosphatidylinositol-specific phospholipase C/glycerophosphodiester phosphodiesterase family protein n=1 Tax=Streptomyces sp. NBC_01341 TaxID=2903831 RepID=UPI002E11C6BC|nr:phosphatidylinositol-specific phospholipase C/glycerophosphodiester phosphodiesterase family protein [Streptomyces sp. NBC_01341]